ncbi:hypothetical protein LTR84_005946 [Exophiala bonariae]|uniref:Mitochondrial fission process protein 1 n=1 Tax=Exophiala bonariae TaxID=1690606 RepID=A0AAV9N2L0_9EURO|nr:hypothetical protein LTR84_005946 [Exophiala bonariae]
MPEDHRGLTSHLLCDVTAAASASIAVSPLVAVVDSSVIRVASSTQRQHILPILWNSFKPLLFSPHRYITTRTSRLLFAVYLGTYSTANAIDTLQEHFNKDNTNPPAISPTTTKLIGVSAISTALTVYKDSCLTQMFGAAIKPKPVPRISYAIFTLRDVLTIYACFVCPPILSARLEELPDSVKDQLLLGKPEARARISQLILPVMVQFVSTPIHLFALDLYNRSHAGLGFADRLARVGRDLPAAVPTRMMRILPAFGVGGVLNTEMRGALRGWVGGSGRDPSGSNVNGWRATVQV